MSQTMEDHSATQEPPAAEQGSGAGSTGGPSAGAPAGGTSRSATNFESLAVAGFIFGIFAVVIAVFAVGLAARAVSEAGSGGGGSTAPSTLAVTLADFSLDPGSAEIAAGGTISLTNEGAVQHDLVVGVANSEMVEAGAEGELVLTDVAPGDYTMYCSVPGHREAGMEGAISVR